MNQEMLEKKYKKKYVSYFSYDQIATMPMHDLYKNIDKFKQTAEKLSSQGHDSVSYECELAWLERELNSRLQRRNR